MRSRVLVVAGLSAAALVSGCGGGSSTVSSASLQPRLLPAAEAPGFGLQRTLDWNDPVNLVGEGLALPQVTHPSAAVQEFEGAHLRGAAGEILVRGSSFNETEATVGVAQFKSAADATRVRDWMHSENLHQPCYGQCIFSPYSVALASIPASRFVVQSSKPPPPPPGAPAGARVGPGPANYLAEFTIGPWAAMLGLISVLSTPRTVTSCVRCPSTNSCSLSPSWALSVSASWLPTKTSLDPSELTSSLMPERLRSVPHTLVKLVGTPKTATFFEDA